MKQDFKPYVSQMAGFLHVYPAVRRSDLGVTGRSIVRFTYLFYFLHPQSDASNWTADDLIISS